MTEKDALRWIDDLIAAHNDEVQKGIGVAADKLGIGWHTVYGWYRRASVPAWRLRDIEAAAKPARRKAS